MIKRLLPLVLFASALASATTSTEDKRPTLPRAIAPQTIKPTGSEAPPTQGEAIVLFTDSHMAPGNSAFLRGWEFFLTFWTPKKTFMKDCGVPLVWIATASKKGQQTVFYQIEFGDECRTKNDQDQKNRSPETRLSIWILPGEPEKK